MNISEKTSGFHVGTPHAWFRAIGQDALSYLQGQFTQDLVKPGRGAASYGLWLSQKGKVVGDSVVLRLTEEELWIWSEGTSEATLRDRLEAYIVADDVALESPCRPWSAVTLLGADAASWLAGELGGVLPEPGRFLGWRNGFVFPGRRGILPAFECVTPEPIALPDAVWARQSVPLETLERHRIAAGIPAVPRDIGPGDLPNEGGLETSAISYQKGCYLGQEVMARLRSLGQVRRSLVRVRGGGGPLTLPHALFQKGRRVGELRTTCRTDDGGAVGMAMVNLMAFDPAADLALEPEGGGVWRKWAEAP